MDGQTESRAPGGDQDAAKNQSAACGNKHRKYKPTYQHEQVVDLWPELNQARADRRADEILHQHGVTDPATRRYCGWVRIQTNGKFYEPHPDGKLAVIVPVFDGDELVDLIAFDPRTPKQWFVRHGNEPLLGSTSDQLLGKPLYVYRTPLNWLRAKRDGVVVLDINRAFIDLKCAPNDIVPEDAKHGRELERAMTQAATWGFPKMLVRKP